MSVKSKIVREIAAPLLTRIGTAVAAFVIGKNVADPTLINDFVVAATATILVGIDLVMSHVARKNKATS